MAPRNERDSVTVKTVLLSKAVFNDAVNATIFIGTQFAGVFSPAFANPIKEWSQVRRDGNEKEFAGIVSVSFRVPESELPSLAVDVSNGNLRLRESASGVKTDFRADKHPFDFAHKSLFELINLLVIEFGFDPLWRSSDAEMLNRISLSESMPDSLMQELREELQFEEGCIVTYSASVNFRELTPLQVILSVTVSNLPRINDVSFRKEHTQSLPCADVATARAFSLPVSVKVLRYPRKEGRTSPRLADSAFIRAGFVGYTLSLARLGRVIYAQAKRLLAPFARVQIAIAQLPEWRARNSSEIRHGGDCSLLSPKRNSFPMRSNSACEPATVW